MCYFQPTPSETRNLYTTNKLIKIYISYNSVEFSMHFMFGIYKNCSKQYTYIILKYFATKALHKIAWLDKIVHNKEHTSTLL